MKESVKQKLWELAVFYLPLDLGITALFVASLSGDQPVMILFNGILLVFAVIMTLLEIIFN